MVGLSFFRTTSSLEAWRGTLYNALQLNPDSHDFLGGALCN